jgi:ABC-type nitrate/sulfonate/bicarbonate transport system permease component
VKTPNSWHIDIISSASCKDTDVRALARGLIIPAAAIVCWEMASRGGLLPVETFSRPSDVLTAGLSVFADGSLLVATAQTLQAAFVGLGIAIVLGVPVGMIIGISAITRLSVAPTLDALRPIPPVALIPLSLLIFGFGVSMEAAVVGFACVWSVIIATTAAVRSMEGSLAEVGRVLELGRLAYMRKIVLPAALARIAVGVRVAVGIALVVAVTVEIVVNPRGLGYGMIIAQQSLRPDLMYAQLLWIGFVGWSINWGLLKLDRTFLSRFSVARGGS